MPKSKRAKVVHLTQVNKRTREQKEKLFQNIRDSIPEYQHCFVFSIDNMRNNYLKDVRHELRDCRIFFGKTKLMARALGQTPEEAQADGIHLLTPLLGGNVGLLFTSRPPDAIISYFAALAPVDFARAGTVAPRGFSIPPGLIYSTGGEVPAEHDVPVEHTVEPELRRLGVPTRMLKGKVVLGGDEAGEGSEGYVVCREGEVLDSRQTRLLKMFSVCMSEFRVRVLGYWTAASGAVTEVAGAEGTMDGIEEAGSESDE